MAKILILIGGHLCTAPRPQKEAAALAEAGHEVTVMGIWSNPKLVQRDQTLIDNATWKFKPFLDFQPQRHLKNLQVRLQTRLARLRYQQFNYFSPNLLGYGAKAMLKAAYQAKADLTIVHSEAGLWVGNQLLNAGFRVGVDFEDWFSEDLLPEARAARPIEQLKTLEARLMRECLYCLTTSQSMATAMAEAYQTPPPTVVYNCFPWAERSHLDHQIRDRRNLNLRSLHWFSQTIGPGRGLELLFQALPHLQAPVEIHLRGNYPESFKKWLDPLIPEQWRDLILIHPTVPNQELLSRISEHDIGLALEVPYCLNRQFTATNKIFQYLQAGLAVVATDTFGQREVLGQYPAAGQVISNQSAITLAQALNKLLQSPEKLTQAKTAALEAAFALRWETQSKSLVHLVENSLVQR
jgi:glycosyltransferase involved in cell wall biosynthesis